MTFQLANALVGAVYLFLDGGALLVILAGFLCIGVGGRFGGLFVLVSGTFPVPVLVFAQYNWTYRLFGFSCLDLLIVCLLRMLLIDLRAWNLGL